MAEFKIRNWRGQEAIERKNRGVAKGLYMAANHILNGSNNIAPFDEGTLTETASTDVDEEAGTASIFYVQKYAARLHEHPEYHFQGGREGKFLEKTMLNDGEEAAEIAAEEIKKELGG